MGKIMKKILLSMLFVSAVFFNFERLANTRTQSFKDRVELFKTAKPDDPDFRTKRKANAVRGNYDVEFLADWDLPK